MTKKKPTSKSPEAPRAPRPVASSPAPAPKSGSKKITTSSTAEYFAKNLQQVGFSSPTKAVLTTLKEAVDNSLDACEESGIAPEISVDVQRLGPGHLKNSDRIRVRVVDNGPGIDPDDIGKVFGEYLASSKFGRGRCTRGQQGIGISAATTWAQQTAASGAKVITKTKGMKKAMSCTVEVDLRNNKGLIKDKQQVEWEHPHGTSVEFTFDGRVQLNGEAGLLNYLKGNILVNPHLGLKYSLPEAPAEVVPRVANVVPTIPPATEPHPHTMKLGEFIHHATLFGRVKVAAWLQKGFSRLGPAAITDLVKATPSLKHVMDKLVTSLGEKEFGELYGAIQKAPLKAPATTSVMSIGEDALARSILRIGQIDFFSVVSRKPCICDLKPIQVEIAIARLAGKSSSDDESVQVLRFANRVPLQFDKAACAIVKSITSVNWRSYGINQPRGGLPTGPYIIAVSVVSPFIKFKNASKETIDASDELVEEIRRALMQGGQRLSRHLTRENRAAELEQRIQHIEQFGPVLVDILCRITKAPATRKKKAEEGLARILERDAKAAKKMLSEAETQLEAAIEMGKVKSARGGDDGANNDADGDSDRREES